MSDDLHILGVDLGGTKLAVGLVGPDGRIAQRVQKPTDVGGGPEAIVGRIVAAANEILVDTDRHGVAVGVGVAGQVDSESGAVRFAPNLKWRDVPLAEMLRKSLHLPVVVTNDVRAATWGEWLHGAGQGCDHFVCIFVGTGIGGGIVSHGRVLEGQTNSAGEIGHMTVSTTGPECTCGNRGCLEALAGGWAIARDARRAVEESPDEGRLIAQLAGSAGITAEHVAQAFRRGDLLAGRIVLQVTEALVAGAASLVNALNPGRLVLGGGVIEGLPHIVAKVADGIRERALQIATDPLEVFPSALGGDAGMIGAAALARRRFTTGKK